MTVTLSRLLYPGRVEAVLIKREFIPLGDLENFLRGLPSTCWRAVDIPALLLEYSRFQHSHRVTCETTFGERSFDFWVHAWQPRLIMIVRPLPPNELVVCCNLFTETAAACIDLSLLSGRNLPFKSPQELHSEHLPRQFRVRHLYDEIRQLALRHNLLETQNQAIRIVFEGLDAELPPDLVLFYQEASPEELQEWLRRLQQASSDEQAGMVMTRCTAGALQLSPPASPVVESEDEDDEGFLGAFRYDPVR